MATKELSGIDQPTLTAEDVDMLVQAIDVKISVLGRAAKSESNVKIQALRREEVDAFHRLMNKVQHLGGVK